MDIWGDGKARREFLYAGDLADAILLAAMDICSIPNLMNIGFGIDYSINHYYETVAEVIGWNGHFKHDLSINSESFNIDSLLELLKKYFNNNNINVDSDELYKVPADQIISAIPQICSFQNNEKQAILEAKTNKERAEVIISLLKMNLLDESENTTDTIN